MTGGIEVTPAHMGSTQSVVVVIVTPGDTVLYSLIINGQVALWSSHST